MKRSHLMYFCSTCSLTGVKPYEQTHNHVCQPKIFISQIWRAFILWSPITFRELPTKLPQLIVIGKALTLGISGSPTWNCLSWHLCSMPASFTMMISKGKRRSGQQSWRLWMMMLLMNQFPWKSNCIQGGWVTPLVWKLKKNHELRDDRVQSRIFFFTIHLSVDA